MCLVLTNTARGSVLLSWARGFYVHLPPNDGFPEGISFLLPCFPNIRGTFQGSRKELMVVLLILI